MSRLFRPIHHTFAPLADADQVLCAICALLWPPCWRNGKSRERLRSAIHRDFGADIFLFSTGREALFALLRALQIGEGNEVIVQAYTCVVVPNAIRAAGARTVYVDIEQDTLNLDPAEVERAITPKTRAIICQHTFGIPAPLSELREICDRHGIPLIEDCAHLIPDSKGPAGIARTGDYALLSFGRDKAISGVTGGAILSQQPDTSHRLREAEESAGALSAWTIARYLLYPLLYALARPLYGIGVGKAFLAIAGKLRLLIPIVTHQEKHGLQEKTVHALPNACAFLALQQWCKRQKINDHRRELVSFYLREGRRLGWPLLAGACEGLPLQKFPLFVANAEMMRRKLKTQNIHLHDGWTGCVVCPPNVQLSTTGYTGGTDLDAERACQQILSLPTHPGTTHADAEQCVELLGTL